MWGFFFLVFVVFRYSIYLKINFVLTWRSLGELGEVLQLRLVVQIRVNGPLVSYPS
jgi:hypothetical protein